MVLFSQCRILDLLSCNRLRESSKILRSKMIMHKMGIPFWMMNDVLKGIISSNHCMAKEF
jgi:hypothetical protein